ncbi:hypothetical protein DCAR_0205807 [Daucus carota subsp. sativus]|uniref:Uncharacterized protein n=1 Tax=Daucus carota subsp. sativus TaxID=79200 RepID=A0AAF0WBT1_DAUCS|nr:hypothetical protein DCAR_0205807 [Daucus carota subsp. sativus]
MESTGIVADKFCIQLSCEDTMSNKLDINNDFKEVSEQWENFQCINVFSGDFC